MTGIINPNVFYSPSWTPSPLKSCQNKPEVARYWFPTSGHLLRLKQKHWTAESKFLRMIMGSSLWVSFYGRLFCILAGFGQVFLLQIASWTLNWDFLSVEMYSSHSVWNILFLSCAVKWTVLYVIVLLSFVSISVHFKMLDLQNSIRSLSY